MKLTIKILGTITLVLFLFFSLFAYIFIEETKEHLSKDIRNDAKAISLFIGNFSIESLLVEDYPQIETHVKNIYDKFENIICVEIYHEDIKVIGNSCDINGLKYNQFTSIISYPGIGDIGKVILYMKDSIDDIVKENVVDMFFYFLAFYIFILFSMVFVIKKLLLDKIEKLSLFSKEIAKGNYSKDISLDTKDELENLAKELKEMSNKIQEKQISLEKALLETKKAKDELEENHIYLLEKEKMASMGEMIGNIAHQWRQPLSAISSLASSISMQNTLGILDNKDLDKSMNNIVDKTNYLSKTIETFRNFLKEKKELKRVILQDRINQALDVVSMSLKDNKIELINEINNLEDIKIQTIIGELDQVIINIINNAKDVLLEKKIQNAWVKVSLEKIDNKVIISIEDNAGGVPSEILPKIFDPYFTTKHKSQGTGLGLHMSFKIISESLNGKLYVENTKNGANFCIELNL